MHAERDLEYEFGRYGRIRDIWVAKNPPGFGLIEFDHPYDVEDAIRGSDGRWLLDRRMIVQRSHKQIQRGRGDRRGDDRSDGRGDKRDYGRDRRDDRNSGRNFERPVRGPKSNPIRTEFRVKFTNLSSRTTWQKLKDALRDMKAIPVYCDTYGDGTGMADVRSNEAADRIVERLDGTDIDGVTIHCARDYEPLSIGVLENAAPHEKGRPSNNGGDKDSRGSRIRSRSRDRDEANRSGEAEADSAPVALIEPAGEEVDYEENDDGPRRGRSRSASN